MDGWKDGWIDGWMGGWMDRWMDEMPLIYKMEHKVFCQTDGIAGYKLKYDSIISSHILDQPQHFIEMCQKK